MSAPQRYPLEWPVGEPRATSRSNGPFKVTFIKARDELLRELLLLGARDIVISSNMPVRQDNGLPLASAPKFLRDPGVAVYWSTSTWDGKRSVVTPFVMTCDRYTSTVANMRAIGLSIAALRALERHGTKRIRDRAFQGFAALPAQAGASSWRPVLGIGNGPVTEEDVARAYRERAKVCHPDHGGSDAAMAELNAARSRCAVPRDLWALTYWRPWSDAITRGPKRCENRGLRPPRHLLGAYHAVHAGQTYDRHCGTAEWPMPAGYAPPPADRSPMGVVGVARILGCLDWRGTKPRIHVPEVAPEGVVLEELIQRLWLLDEDDWWSGPCGILLDEVTAIEPVPCRGARGWWRVPDAEAALVRTRWREARLVA